MYRRYEIPKGPEKGYLKVFVDTNLVARLGEVSVNWGALSKMYNQALDVNTHMMPTTFLRQLSGNSQLNPADDLLPGRYKYASNNSYIDASGINEHMTPDEAAQLLTRTLVHHGQLCRDSHRPWPLFDKEPTWKPIAGDIALRNQITDEYGPLITFSKLPDPYSSIISFDGLPKAA